MSSCSSEEQYPALCGPTAVAGTAWKECSARAIMSHSTVVEMGLLHCGSALGGCLHDSRTDLQFITLNLFS